MTTNFTDTLILTFFGTTADAGLKVYDQIQSQMAKRYPDMTIKRAFTSKMVIRRLQERGVIVPDLPQLLASLKQQGVKTVAVLPFLIAPGQEYGKITAALAAEPDIRSICAKPLLTDMADYEAVITALEPDIPDNIPTVIGCHGNEHHDRYNHEIREFAALMEARHSNVMLAAIEGENPGTRALSKARELAQVSGAVHFIPLMLVAGDHVMNDMMGDEEDSWKVIVGADSTTCSEPAGMNSRIIEIYCQHLDTALKTA